MESGTSRDLVSLRCYYCDNYDTALWLNEKQNVATLIIKNIKSRFSQRQVGEKFISSEKFALERQIWSKDGA